MPLKREQFADFFAAVHEGHAPFAWQERLLDRVLEQGRWPGSVVAPTGAGKTAVLDVHVFALALAADGQVPMPPRRLALVVNRRVLVDDQYRHARFLAECLDSDALDAASASDGVLGVVAEQLWRLRGRTVAGSPLLVGRLRGGFPPSRRWRDEPTAAGVLCATPDMWGSRLLFGGYGSTVGARPLEAGLLAFDSVVVVDEAHLARQLLCTARQIGELTAAAEEPLPVPGLQVVETTATPDSARTDAVGVVAEDLRDPVLAARLTRAKPIELRTVTDWDSPRSTRPIAALVQATRDMITTTAKLSTSDTTETVGCFVNTVPRAVAVATALRTKSATQPGLRVILICGQARPIDIDLLETEFPGLLTPTGNSAVDVLVTTQSLEVGVDLDLAGIVSELAPATALTQRAGRGNRRGLRTQCPITVITPAAPLTERARSGPYEAPELNTALEWITAKADTADGLSPWAISTDTDPLPPQRGRRELLQRPELGQAWHWARSSETLAAAPELDLWLADDLDEDTSIGMIVRENMPTDTAAAIELIRLLRPRRHEVFSIPLRTARDALITAYEHLPDELAPMIVCRGEDIAPLRWRTAEDRAEGKPTPVLRPGDLLVLDARIALFTHPDDRGPQVLVPATDATATPARFPAADRLEAEAELPAEQWRTRERGGVVARLSIPDSFLPEDTEDSAAVRVAVQAWLREHAAGNAMHAAAAALLDTPPRNSDVGLSEDVVPSGEDDAHRDHRGVFVLDRRRASADDGVREEWVRAEHPVTLAAHQHAVAERAVELARTLRLPEKLVAVLDAAGAHHDDGKADPRFQRKLLNPAEFSTDEPLAKNPPATTAQQRRRNAAACGLPPEWRHEQRSVVDAWDALRDTPDPHLTARLIGTSHGYGRAEFPHTATQLIDQSDERAEALFDLGDWHTLIERTHRRYGLWGCAYLEAVLRCADGQISGEGR